MPKSLNRRVDASGGINLLRDATFIQDTELQRGTNMFPRKPGRISKRGGLGFVGAPSVLSTAGYPIAHIRPPFDNDLSHLFALRDINDTSLWLVKESSGLSYGAAKLEGFRSLRRPCFVSYGGKVYVFYGRPLTSKAGSVVSVTGTTASIDNFAFAGNGNVFSPGGACIYRNRMVFWDLAPGFENSILFADYGDPTLIGNNALDLNTGRFIDCWDVAGDRVVACTEITMTSAGTPAQSALLILKEYSGGVLTGEPNDHTKTLGPELIGNATISKYSFSVGCASPETLAHTPYGTIWAGHDDVWFFATGQAPVRIGTKIRPALTACHPSNRYLWHAAYLDGVYRLACMDPDTQTGGDDDAACGVQWWLDLRDGPPQSHADAKWYGPMKFKVATTTQGSPTTGTRTMAVDSRPGARRLLTGVEYRASGTPVIVQYDLANGYDKTFPDTSLHSNDGCEIQMELQSKQYDFGDDELDKIVDRLEVAPSISTNTAVEADFICDGGRDISTGAENLSLTGYQLDVAALDTGVMYNSTQPTAIEPDISARHTGTLVEFKLRDKPGFVVTDANDTFAFTIGSTQFTVTLTQGFYADIVAFCSQLVSKMSLAAALTFTHNQIAGARPSLVAIATSSQWFPRPSAGNETKAVLAMLGYDTTVDPALATTQTASTIVHDKQSSLIEFNSANFIARPILRRPV